MKVSRTVLRGGESREAQTLPDRERVETLLSTLMERIRGSVKQDKIAEEH